MSRRFYNPYFKEREPQLPGMQWLQTGDSWAYLASAGLVLVVLIYLVISHRWFWIDYITIRGNQYVTIPQITEPTKQVLHSRRWLVLPQRLYPIVNLEKINQAIRSNIENQFVLEDLTIEKDFSNTLVIIMKERVPGLTYILNTSYYYLDHTGIITTTLPNSAAVDPHFPHIRDANTNRTVKPGEAVVSQAVIDFIIQLSSRFTPTVDLNVAEYKLPSITCQQKQFVAERLFNDEIEHAATDETKAKKKKILQQLKAEKITVDESLALLEEVKRTEAELTEAETEAKTDAAFIQFQSQFVEADCNYPAVIRDVYIVTQEGPEIYFDSSVDLTVQLHNLQAVLTEKIDDINQLDYIDVRFVDRVYFQ